jgi:hypothetical protein
MSDRRNAKAAKRFLSAVLKRSRELDPAGDQYRQEPGLPRGDRRVKKEGMLPKDTQRSASSR